MEFRHIILVYKKIRANIAEMEKKTSKKIHFCFKVWKPLDGFSRGIVKVGISDLLNAELSVAIQKNKLDIYVSIIKINRTNY